MINRIALAFSKLFFCVRISADWSTFFRLIYNTKKLKWYKKDHIAKSSAPVTYNIKINKQSHTIYLRTFEGDIDIFYEIFWKKVYRLPNTDLAGTGKVFIDLGANIGMTALFFHAFYNPALLICVEPAGENFELLVKNAGHLPNIQTINAAVMNSEGWVRIKKEVLHYNNKAEMSVEDASTVKAVTIGSLYTQYVLDEVAVLKIDIEGAEEAVFSTDDRFLDNTNKVLIEIHSPAADNICLRTLRKKGFDISQPEDQGAASAVFFASRP